MALVLVSIAGKAKLWRLDGNAIFKKECIGAAMDAYTEAITLCPNVAVYWTNRALCYQKRKSAKAIYISCSPFSIISLHYVDGFCISLLVAFGREWTKVEEDCRKALELDSNSVKAHYMLGLALIERQEFAGGIKQLHKAFDLGRGRNPVGCMVEEIWQTLAKAKYMEWELSWSNHAWRLQNLKEACERALAEYHFLDNSLAEDASKDAADDHSEQLELLNEVFCKAAQADMPTQVPDYLCCKITLDIFRDPVITPSGVTYERAVLLEHLKQVGKFDPVTREPLEQHQLVPNLALKEAVQAYLNEHGWAYNSS
ncbi:E3 ubiquitin-protein ligase CHIP-like isoform X2 [Phoenix dactylifera]|uniref:E3 ubiquitin-protein ligase CHIP n=1 Tax=Phoenix dactylifera TaxID=42345 RepID=A0A8B8J963_PHODC|nr:E3 ubiquitin-protein ligase CHIP-like isoform X2 [Phoenix dactylifera]